MSTVELALLVFGVLLGATALGVFAARRVHHVADSFREPLGILQGALLALVGLMLAFGLSLALSRYEDRRANVVATSNAISTAYLRAQTIPEPMRSRSLALFPAYTRTAIAISDDVPGSAGAKRARAGQERIERRLWALGGDALARAPVASAPRLYAESLNEMFDDENARVASLGNRVPTAVLILEIFGAAAALGLLAAHLHLAGRGVGAVTLAALLIGFLLFVTADLDRPTRGNIRVPDAVLRDQLEAMRAPPAAAAPE